MKEFLLWFVCGLCVSPFVTGGLKYLRYILTTTRDERIINEINFNYFARKNARNKY